MSEWTPNDMDEAEEAALIELLTAVKKSVGAEKFVELADALLWKHKDLLLKHPDQDNPAVKRLRRLMERQERGFE